MQFHRWIAVEVLGMVVEVALWVHSMSLIWGLQMKLKKRILILTVFACRLLYVVTRPSQTPTEESS